MFAKLFNKQSSNSQENKAFIDLNPQVIAHYGIPSTASHLAYDPIQQLLAVGTLDGRIKVIGSDSIEGLLTSPKELPFKNLEFLQNQGFLIGISNDNNIQVWDLEHRSISSVLQWESNITAFSVVQETNYMYIGEDCGLVSVIKYDIEEKKILRQQYTIPIHSVFEVARIPLHNNHSVVGVLPQPCSSGCRVLLTYVNGVIVLWDVSKDQMLCVRGWNNHQANGDDLDISANTMNNEVKDQILGDDIGDKEIISLCWASSDGSILAVGYVDGDIMLWNLSDIAIRKDHKAGNSANNAVKLQLSSANKRFPVIVLHWSEKAVHDDHGGLLFVYGGDEIGSSEVLTILDLEWSPKKDSLKNVIRANVTLQGSFADMILLQNSNVVEDTEKTSLFLLTSPGQLQYYDSLCLSGLISDPDKPCTIPFLYRSVVPTSEPYLTVGKFISIVGNTNCSAALSEMASTVELQEKSPPGDNIPKWPLNGGVPCHLSLQGERKVERLYIAGYQDGSVRMWDATYPIFSPILVWNPVARGITDSGTKGSVSALDFSSETLNIAIGNDSGMVSLHSLVRNYDETKLRVVSGIKSSEVCDVNQRNESCFSAVFTLSASPVSILSYTNFGARLAVGYKSGQVAMLNVTSTSVLFFIDTLSSPDFHVVSFSPAISLETYGLTNSLDQIPLGKSETGKEVICALTDDLHLAVLDSSTGDVIGSVSKLHHKDSTAISMYILGGAKCITEVFGGEYTQFLSQEDKEVTKVSHAGGFDRGSDGVDQSRDFVQSSMDLQILLCCTDVFLLYSLKSVIQGHIDSICEVPLLKTSYWTKIFKYNEEYGLLIFYQTGSIEIRSLPKLEVLGELSLLSILRWNFRSNMDKTLSCTENGQIALVNGCEFVILSLLASENDFRIPQSLPCLYDQALAAALDLNFSSNQKKNKETSLGFLDAIMKGLRASKEAQSKDAAATSKSLRSVFNKVFSKSSKPDASVAAKDVGEAMELNIDDIEIDGPLRVSPVTHKSEDENKVKHKEREKLFEGGTSETKPPRQRTIEEIKAKYKKDPTPATASAASAASEAKNKLMERQEKLERIGQNSEELRNSAENFSSMAKELAKKMENRKWWQL